MNPAWLGRNLAISWRHRASLADFFKRLLLIYGERLATAGRGREWMVGFRYAAPIGDVRLVLRANRGADAFILSEIFEHEYYRLPLPQAPETILDLGANIGLSTIYFSRMFPAARLACVEPAPENVRILSRNLTLNGVRAEVIAAAVDVKDGTATMERGVNDYGHRLMTCATSSPGTTFDVAAISVPSVLRRLGWQRAGLLKIDIEGHEKPLLTEACDWLNLVDALCVEYHLDGAEAELSRVATRYGFLAPRRLPGAIWLLAR
jgi:FkbM family methyltransferase